MTQLERVISAEEQEVIDYMDDLYEKIKARDPHEVEFLQATKKGYEYAIENPEESAEILHKYAPEYDVNMLIERQKYLANEYKAEVEKWGYIDANRWNNFYNWAYEKGIITKDLTNKGFTNNYLE